LRKIEYTCDYIRAEKISAILACDLICEARRSKQEEAKELERIKLKEKEEKENQLELELFEKKFGPKKLIRRKETKVQVEATSNHKYKIAVCSCLVLLLAVVLFFYV
jgi:Flp pilus assembly protein TadB